MSPEQVRETWPFLTPPQAAAVLLYERGLSQRDIARVIGITRAAVRDRLDGAERRIIAHEQEVDR